MSQSVVKKDEPTLNIHPDYSILHFKEQKELILFHLVPYIYQNLKALQNELLQSSRSSGPNGGHLRSKSPPCIGKIRIETFPNGQKKFTLIFNEPSAKIFPFSLMPTFTVTFDRISQGYRFIFSYNRQTGFVSFLGRIKISASNSPNETDRASEIRTYINEAKKKMLFNDSKDVNEDDTYEIPEYQKAKTRHRRSDNRETLSDDEIRAAIISLYREKTSWKLNEICSRIDQPTQAIKRVLDEVCIYNNGFYEINIH